LNANQAKEYGLVDDILNRPPMQTEEDDNE
jgi:hypothetical protein